MKNPLYFLFLLGFTINMYAQDTIVVQTLTYDSITTRRGTWQFPEGETFRKILMYHTLKCDIMTQHDQYPCGEWDYLTYNIIYQHTGLYDSNLYYHPNYTLAEGSTPDSILLTGNPTFSLYRHTHRSVTYPDTIQYLQAEIGSPAEYAPDVIQTGRHSGRSQFLWKADELTGQGFTAGPITGLKLHILEFGAEARHFMIRMKNVTLNEITPDTLITDMDTVFCDFVNFDMGWRDFNFYNPFEWTGQSNIVVDFSFSNPEALWETILFAEDPGFNCGITAGSDGLALDLDGSADFLKIPEDTYFNSNLTFEVWFLKRSNNHWSRIFDFGNGPGKQNVIVALSKETSGKLSFHINKDGLNRSFELNDPTPLNEWTHVTLRLTDHLGWVYINGNFVKLGLLQQPPDVSRGVNYIGRSNWDGDKMADVLLDEFRLYNTALEPEEIKAHYRKALTNPASEPNLNLYYNFDEESGNIMYDLSAGGHHATGFGLPNRYRIQGHEIFMGFEQYNLRPWIIFERLESGSTQIVDHIVMDTVINSKTQVILYSDPNDPTIPTDTLYKWQAGHHYVYDQWQKVDSVWFEPDEILMREDIPYYGEPFEILEEHEIGRYITPYGIGLSLGPEGFTWIYDVTDYAPLLQGEVELSAGNQQELIDLKFVFIKGFPPREVKKIDRIWGKFGSYYYRDLDNDTVLKAVTLPLLPGAEQFRVKTRLTGHGHNSNTGEYPHCCEWKDNEHYLFINGAEAAAWHIFQYHDCGLNPVYPQGGTWPGAREGWCPGDLVKEHDFEITGYITGDEVTIDYDITPVPEANQGMGWGNYVVAMDLIHYGPNLSDLDAEVYDVVSPNNYEYYSRVNPICRGASFILRNNGSYPLQSVKVVYGVSGGMQEMYHWSGSLMPHQSDTVVLPVPGVSFWKGDNAHIFTVTVSEPTGNIDQHPDNNTYSTRFNMPDLINAPFISLLKTNLQAYRYSLEIKDIAGNVYLLRDNLQNNTYYQDTLDLPYGCYTLLLTDTEDMGLTYWAYPEQGVGFYRLLNMDSILMKHFKSEFGRTICYTFYFGEESYIQEPGFEESVSIYPNPAENTLFVEVSASTLPSCIQLFNMQGAIVRKWKNSDFGGVPLSLDLAGLPKGLYILELVMEGRIVREKIIRY
ncbi:MAG: T9SS type A sorting domain-containing protein [Bacteroidales bacterium]|nr:T9SS type A sorting domain-containing protein [Bacteroidales bacterium]